MGKKKERKTYASMDALYSLDPARVFDVVADLNRYIHYAKDQAMRDNPDCLRPATGLIGNGRTLVLSTEVVNQPDFLASFDLAELVLSEDSRKLTFATHKHPRVSIPSKDLHYIVTQYKLK